MDNNESVASYTDLLLGDAMSVIIDTVANNSPRCTESQFRNYVLPLLIDPFKKENFEAYGKVIHDYTNMLVVHADNDENEVLFTVPALLQSPSTNLLNPDAVTVCTAIRDINAEATRGVKVDHMLTDFLSKITVKPDIGEMVLKPIQEILSRYGLTLLDSENNFTAEIKPETIVSEQSSFTDEYE